MEASQTVLPFKLSTTDEWLTAHCGLDLSRTDGSRPGGAQGGSAVGGKRIRAKTSPAGSFAASRGAACIDTEIGITIAGGIATMTTMTKTKASAHNSLTPCEHPLL